MPAIYGHNRRSEARASDRVDRTLTAQTNCRTVLRVTAFGLWRIKQRARVSKTSPWGEVLRYIARFRKEPTLFLSDGRIKMDNNAVERHT